MAKRVFFSFHYKDVVDFRANIVRNHWITKLNREDSGYFDMSLWENTKTQGDFAIKRLINNGLENTSVTCVLIGSDTSNRRWVRYEIMKSLERGNSVLGININCIKGKDGQTKSCGANPFEYLGLVFSRSGDTGTLFEKTDGSWIEYKEINGSSIISNVNHSPEYRGKSYNMSYFYPVYDWIADDGYNNFSKWVDL